MMKAVLILGLACMLLIVAGCSQGEDDLRLYKGIPSAEIPSGCLDSRDDVCSLFSCMVEQCWCDKTPDHVLYEKDAAISDESEAKSLVKEYVDLNNPDYVVNKAVKLNNVFYNVFAQDPGGNEEVFTVSADGTIIRTVCGV